MSELNKEWAIQQLKGFLDQVDQFSSTRGQAVQSRDILAQLPVVEKILDRVSPGWRGSRFVSNSLELAYEGDWLQHKRVAPGAIATLERDQELMDNLGDLAPSISASDLHPWVWSGAKSLWQSGHFRSAVEDALKKVNAELQNKVGRRDLSETKLFQESFSDKHPQAGKSRLRRMADDGSDTYRSLQRGAMALAEGIYAGIRNPLNHEAPEDISEQIALEYLAALSVLARWVDDATLEEVS